ncbi:hypothetical protein QD357_10500 [Rhizobium sp. BR 317]|uniref:hypothetical protein n=1 Tax=Rhizobium sp. BR 317 TaxID=3040015 RepID=UPI0039BFEB41
MDGAFAVVAASAVEAANCVQKLARAERRHLLGRGVTASGALRGLLTRDRKYRTGGRSRRSVNRGYRAHIDEMSDEIVSKALLAWRARSGGCGY